MESNLKNKELLDEMIAAYRARLIRTDKVVAWHLYDDQFEVEIEEPCPNCGGELEADMYDFFYPEAHAICKSCEEDYYLRPIPKDEK